MRKRLLTIAAALCLGLVFMVGTALADGTAVRDVKVEADGVTISALAEKDCTLLAVLYDENGRMMDVQTADVTAGTPLENTKLIWDAWTSGADTVKVFLVEANETAKPVARSCALAVPQEGEESPAAGLDFAVLLGTDRGAFGTQAKLLFADGTKKIVDLDSNYDNVNNLMIGELYTFRTNADGEYQLDPAPDSSSSGYDYTGQGGTVQPQSDTNGNAGYIDGYEIADDAVIFVQYDVSVSDYVVVLSQYSVSASYKVITGTNLCAMSASDFTCNYVLATDSETGAGKVNMAYVTANRSSVIGGTRQNTATESGFAVLLAWNQDAFTTQAKLLLEDGSKVVVDLDGGDYDLTVGQLYTYETNADREYRLSPAPSDQSSGYDYTSLNATVQPQSDTNGSAGYINGYEIADDAVIFETDGGEGYKVISGAGLKEIPAENVYVRYAAANEMICLAYVQTGAPGGGGGGGGPSRPRPVEASVTSYGYVMGIVQIENASQEEVYQLDLWTKDGAVSLKTTTDVRSAPVRGGAIAYRTNDSREICEILDNKTPDDTAAITEVSDSEVWIDGTPTPLDPDVVVLVVDMDNRYGIEVGGIYSISVAVEAEDGSCIPNAMVLYDKDGEVAAIVYDVNNGETL